MFWFSALLYYLMPGCLGEGSTLRFALRRQHKDDDPLYRTYKINTTAGIEITSRDEQKDGREVSRQCAREENARQALF